MRKELLLVLTVVLAGCTVPAFGGNDHPDAPNGEDSIGWENGYWYDDPVDVTTEDGLNESEREAVTARTMARIEQIRNREFIESVPVDVISRAEYRNRSRGNGSSGGPPEDPWNDQVWESLLLIGEESGSSEAIDDTLSTSVQGFYSPSRDEIVIVSPTETPHIDRRTLAHELVHALQDQQFGLNGSAETQDQQLARDGLVEGEANYVQYLYQRRCEDDWSCVARPERSGGGGGSGPRYPGLFTVIYQPYATGPAFIDSVYGDGGWDAVDAVYEQYPESTEQVIHPEKYPDEEPENVTVPDRSNDEWNRFDHDPVADTVGEASIFATMYHNNQTDASRYRYESEPSAGWGGDSVVPYRNASGAGGYVWVSTWDSEEDARQFARAYRAALVEEHGATQPRTNVYVVPDSSSFADAFRVTRSGDTVRIVNGPTVEDLDGIHRPRGS
ncbi:Hvo_1808 family surface protein [Halomicroarcula sp. F13]|uniref:Hvo_1808 family surface protein n=1 Tax=Haloarcula rubra TaxID=2487747 RepID=A0AAW4PNU4_9EURY|nr:Hvo_1808 family surface protein [Halomicroarcula rubra]MBX0322791.1 Hvo_1808 family surface protein [Halomicroarcula rubra]